VISKTEEYIKIQHFPRLCPRPAVGAYSVLPDLLAGGEGAGFPHPKTSPPEIQPFGLAVLAVRASHLRMSGFDP